MNAGGKPAVQDQRGVSLIEVLVAVLVFILLIGAIDAVFITTRRSAAQAELASDVNQNIRIAVERLTREIRESGVTSGDILISSQRDAVVFRSARPEASSTVFCVNVRDHNEQLHNSACNYFGNPPAQHTHPVAGVGTYYPLWQKYVGYCRNASREIVRYTAALANPTSVLQGPANCPPSGVTDAVVASGVERFLVTSDSTAGTIAVTMEGKETQTVQGSLVPAQQIEVATTVLVRNRSNP